MSNADLRYMIVITFVCFQLKLFTVTFVTVIRHGFALQLDVLSSGNSYHEVAHIANGSHPRNCVSLLRINVSLNIFHATCCDWNYIMLLT